MSLITFTGGIIVGIIVGFFIFNKNKKVIGDIVDKADDFIDDKVDPIVEKAKKSVKKKK